MVLLAVHGSSSRLLPAERGTVRVAVELDGEDRADVVRRVAELHERLVGEAQALVASGAATAWTSRQVSVRVEHRYEGADAGPRVVQVATAEVGLRFRDLEALATWVLRVGADPGVRVDGVEWAVTEEHRAATERELRVLAVRDAIARAEAYASAIGGTAVALRSLWEDGLRPGAGTGEPGWGGRAEARMKAAAPGLQLRPDDIEIVASVSADFEITAGD